MKVELAKKLDVERCIIWGDALRVLLNSNQITQGDISKMLREKGVFLDSSDRGQLVSLLSSTLLTPSEFERLISTSYSRETKPKTNTEELTLTSAAVDWRSEILKNLPEILGAVQLNSGYSYLEEPSVTRCSDGSVEIVYGVRKEDASQEWIAQQLDYGAKISIKQKSGTLKLEILKSHSAKETDRVNAIYTRAFARHLKAKGIVTEDRPKGVLFEDFSNEERITFMLHFTGASEKSFSFQQLIDVDIVRDQAAGLLPDGSSLSWMENKVKKLHVSGEKLHEIDFMRNKLLHKYCFLVRMNAVFHYQYGLEEGDSTVTLWFGGKAAHDVDYAHTEFTISVDRIGRASRNADRLVRGKIEESLIKLKDSALERIRADRSAASATAGQHEVEPA